MKKIFLISGLILLSFWSNAELKFGLRLSPSIAWSRVTPRTYIGTEDVNGVSTSYRYENKGNGAGLRWNGGVLVEYTLTKYVSFASGINFSVNGAGFKSKKTNLSTNKVMYDSSMKYSLQYLQIPLTLKFYTNDIAEDIKLYFQIGITGDINVGSKVKGLRTYQNGNATESYRKIITPLSSNFIFSPGIEYQLGSNTSFFAGITYSRGLSGINRQSKNNVTKDISGFTLKNDYISIDGGIKF